MHRFFLIFFLVCGCTLQSFADASANCDSLIVYNADNNTTYFCEINNQYNPWEPIPEYMPTPDSLGSCTSILSEGSKTGYTDFHQTNGCSDLQQDGIQCMTASYCSGNYTTAAVCGQGQQSYSSNNIVQFCYESNGQCRTPITYDINSGQVTQQSNYTQGECQYCGLYPASKCPDTCRSGQTAVKDSSGNVAFCTNNSNGQCLTPINYSSGSASTQSSYSDGDCSTCGLYPVSNCPDICAQGQTAVKDSNGNIAFCTNSQNQCLTPINYSSGSASTQSSYNGGDCSTCGLYPVSNCPDVCAQGQTAVKDSSGNIAFCTNSSNQCLTPINYSSGSASTQSSYNGGDCSTCGLYPVSNCPDVCAQGQTAVKDSSGNIAFCTNSSNQCLSPINYSSGSASTQSSYNGGDCSTCGLYPVSNCPDICAQGQTAVKDSNGNIAFCTNSQNQCLTPINYSSGSASTQSSYNSGDCSTCGLYPVSNCPDICGSGQTAVKDSSGNIAFCTNSSNQCLTPINYSSGSASTQSSYNGGDCSTCGLYPVSNCPDVCAQGQTAVKDSSGNIAFCTNSQNQCLTPINYSSGSASTQSSYNGGDCSTCGLYPVSNCPDICAQGQTAVKDSSGNIAFCTNSQNQCLTPINYSSGSASTQSSYNGGDCSTCGLYPVSNCPDVCAQGQTAVKDSSGNVSFCTNSQNQCLTPINYSSGSASTQSSYNGGDCSTCGLYPVSNCPDVCAQGQTAVKDSSGNVSFCTNSQNQCLTPINYSSGSASTQSSYNGGDCSTCGLYPVSNCPDVCAQGQTAVKDSSGNIAFCTNNQNQCLTPINYSSGSASTQSSYNGGDCSTCGLYPVSNCPDVCAQGQTAVKDSSGNVSFCTNSQNQCLTPINYSSGSASTQSSYNGGDCSTCGLYPVSNCPDVCAQGQTAVKDSSGNVSFCTNSQNQCLTPINYSSGSASSQSSYSDGDCSTCGLYPVSNCPDICAQGQTAVKDSSGNIAFCTNSQNQCLTPINYSSGSASTQSSYNGGDCSTCGLYPVSNCPDICAQGQTAVKDSSGNIAFCTNSQNQCLTPINYSSGSASTQSSYNGGDCSTCGLYPVSNCPDVCAQGQTAVKDSSGNVSFCTNSQNQCLTPINYSSGSASTQSSYNGGDCSTCGLYPVSNCPDVCAQGQTAVKDSSGNIAFCTNNQNQCLTPINYSSGSASSQSSYSDGDCSTCGLYPVSNCPDICAQGQTAVKDGSGNIAFCTNNQNQCLTPINYSSGSTSSQSSYNGGDCSTCGLYPVSNCPDICGSGQTAVKDSSGNIAFCTNSQNQCLTPINYSTGMASQQSNYTSGDCSTCGLYPVSNCPAICAQGQTAVKDGSGNVAFCTNSQNQCLTPINYSSGSTSSQSSYNGGDCSTCGLYPNSNCPDTCAQGQTAVKDSSGNIAFCTNSQNQCLTPISYSTGMASQQSNYTSGDCSTCGLYPVSNCPAICAQGQTAVKDDSGNVAFCTNSQNQCLTPINYSSGSTSSQSSYNGGDCSTCGLYPISNCPDTCAQGQTAVKDSSGNIAFCTNNQNQCLTPISYSTGMASQQSNYTSGDCSTCGLYPVSNCPPACGQNQNSIKNNGDIIACVSSSQECLTVITYDSGEPSEQNQYYGEGMSGSNCCNSGYYGQGDNNTSTLCPPLY